MNTAARIDTWGLYWGPKLIGDFDRPGFLDLLTLLSLFGLFRVRM
jgi:hypothetical protein